MSENKKLSNLLAYLSKPLSTKTSDEKLYSLYAVLGRYLDDNNINQEEYDVLIRQLIKYFKNEGELPKGLSPDVIEVINVITSSGVKIDIRNIEKKLEKLEKVHYNISNNNNNNNNGYETNSTRGNYNNHGGGKRKSKSKTRKSKKSKKSKKAKNTRRH